MGTKQSKNTDSLIVTGILGDADFCRRTNAIIRNYRNSSETFAAPLADAWSAILTNRPNLIILEIGFWHSDRSHSILRQVLSQVRDRNGRDVFIAVVLSSPEKLGYGGDLLYANPTDLEPSGIVDTFLALPPSHMPSLPSLTDQIENLYDLVEYEFQRRAEGSTPLPALGDFGWVQSLSDPRSRELWMKWLPRYASYTNENPIILGNTGTGKTNFARALHMLSGRTGDFVSITPRDFSSSELIQVELFGSVAGAYTGAVDKWGLVHAAQGGTLFIDELQSIDKDLQGKLITFIENKIYRRVGSSDSNEADVRFVFASNRTLYEMVNSDTLRDDFAYRLERVQLDLRPLESRRLDVASALAYSLAKIHRQRPLRNPISGVSGTAFRKLIGGRWPGNLRQLENTTARLCELADMGDTTLIDDSVVRQALESTLSFAVSTPPEVFTAAAEKLARMEEARVLTDLKTSLEKYTEIVRITALDAAGGDLNKASRLIDDDPHLLDLVAQRIIAEQEVKRIE